MTNELYHHGILGQKWGVRRYQNPDGSLTSEGRDRYGRGTGKKKGIIKRGVERYMRGSKFQVERDDLAEKETQKNVTNQKKMLRYQYEAYRDRDESDDEPYGWKQHQEDTYARAEREGREKAESIIRSKYGDQAVNDANFADIVDVGIALTVGAAFTAAVMIPYNMLIKSI